MNYAYTKKFLRAPVYWSDIAFKTKSFLEVSVLTVNPPQFIHCLENINFKELTCNTIPKELCISSF